MQIFATVVCFRSREPRYAAFRHSSLFLLTSLFSLT
ncbi:hypothetical protein T09_11258 [Trichinella sp. T9]|nr:hypothetical protein T09_11258 [Trichinella sp. T9]